MSKFRSAILIIGLLIFFVASSLLTVLILYATGVIVTDPIELVYSVDNAEKTYDGTPLTATVYRLESGEILEGHTARVEIKGSQLGAGESESTLSVTVLDKNGFDVSDKYAVKVNTGKLTVTKQEITVQVTGAEIVYNGQQADFGKDGYEVISGSLATGHSIAAFSENTTLLNAGDELPQDLHPIVYDSFGTQVTENYNVTFNFTGAVKIVKRPITVKPAGVTKIYDGTVVTADKFEISGGTLAAGQTARASVVKVEGGAASAQNVSKNHIKIDEGAFAVYADDGSDVTKNYEISYETDYLNIEKRDITLSTANASFVYDGNEHFDETISVISGSLASGQSLEVTEHTALTDVDKQANDLTYQIRGEGGDVSGNYNIIYIAGTIEVTKRALNISLKNFVAGTYTGEEIELDVTNAFYRQTEGGAAGGEAEETVIEEWNLELTDFTIVPLGSTVNAGDYSYTASYNKEKSNFDMTFNYGRYEIKRKEVTLADKLTTVRTVTYGGTYDFDFSKELCIQEENGYTVSAAYYTTKNDIAKRAQVLTFTGVRVKNDKGTDITDNLNINTDGFKITATLTARNLMFTYTECEASSGYTQPAVLKGHAHYTLANGDTAEYEMEVNGVYFIVKEDSVVIKNSNGDDVTDLYNIDVGGFDGDNPNCGMFY